MENVQIGIEILGTESIREATKALQELDRELGRKPEIIQKVSAALQPLSTGMKITSQQFKITRKPISEVVEEIKPLAEKFELTKSQMRAIAEVSTTMQEKFGLTAESTEALRASLIQTAGAYRLSRRDMMIYAELLAKQPEKAKAFLESLPQMELGLAKVGYTLRRTTAELGPTGVALVRLSREFFWTGLGLMFMTMSIARVARMQFSLRRAHISLGRATRSLRRAEAERLEILREYGPASDEYRRAEERVIEAQIRVKEAHLRIIEANQMTIYSYFMLAFGTIPTVIRVLSSLLLAFKSVSISQLIQTAITQKQTAALWGLRLGFVGVILAAGYMAYVMYETNRQIAEVTSQMEELEKQISELPIKSASPISIKTKWGGWVEVPEILETPRISPRISPTKIDTVNIRIEGPFYIREEADIRKIRNSLENLFLRGYFSRGGRL
jgi:hypothetical protein